MEVPFILFSSAIRMRPTYIRYIEIQICRTSSNLRMYDHEVYVLSSGTEKDFQQQGEYPNFHLWISTIPTRCINIILLSVLDWSSIVGFVVTPDMAFWQCPLTEEWSTFSAILHNLKRSGASLCCKPSPPSKLGRVPLLSSPDHYINPNPCGMCATGRVPPHLLLSACSRSELRQ